jgi:hypothetical protein
MKSNKKKWLEVIGFTVVGTATWLNPSAGVLLFLLELCFQILAALQKDEEKTESADEEKTENVEEKE